MCFLKLSSLLTINLAHKCLLYQNIIFIFDFDFVCILLKHFKCIFEQNQTQMLCYHGPIGSQKIVSLKASNKYVPSSKIQNLKARARPIGLESLLTTVFVISMYDSTFVSGFIQNLHRQVGRLPWLEKNG